MVFVIIFSTLPAITIPGWSADSSWESSTQSNGDLWVRSWFLLRPFLQPLQTRVEHHGPWEQAPCRPCPSTKGITLTPPLSHGDVTSSPGLCTFVSCTTKFVQNFILQVTKAKGDVTIVCLNGACGLMFEFYLNHTCILHLLHSGKFSQGINFIYFASHSNWRKFD